MSSNLNSRDGTGAAESETGDLLALKEKFLRYLLKERGLSANTGAAYESDIRAFIKWLGKESSSMNRSNLTRYLQHLKSSGLASSTIARKLATLRAWFDWQKSNRITQNDPTEGIMNPKSARHLPKVLSNSEISSMVAAAGTARERLIVELLYGAGLRVSELISLTHNDINLSHGYIRCTGKGSKERIVPIGKQALEAIRLYQDA
ncbi:MAG: site-specific integrase, partial [Candidatus Obscuribacterales bacterium]|nr:site-specific integrase [Candidatus Obscuribacterales bacterium]